MLALKVVATHRVWSSLFSGRLHFRRLFITRLGQCFCFASVQYRVNRWDVDGTGAIPPELGRLKALQTLDLYHNQLSGGRYDCHALLALSFPPNVGGGRQSALGHHAVGQ